jgi:predicted ATPase
LAAARIDGAGVAAGALGIVAGPVALAGRARELSRLLVALGGDARLVLVTGEAGVGKTRFTAEGIARASAGRMVVVRGECLPLAHEIPLLAVSAALRELAAMDGGAVLDAALETAPGFARGEVGRLLLALGLGGGSAAGGRDGEWRRQRLLSAVAELLDRLAGEPGAALVLIVEDVHWADIATLDFLTFLARPGRRSGVKVVVTCCSDEAPLAAPVADWLAEARSDARVEEIALGPLSRAEVAEQVATLVGGAVSPTLVDELFARAEGNPFSPSSW